VSVEYCLPLGTPINAQPDVAFSGTCRIACISALLVFHLDDADEVSGFGVQARSVEEGALVCHWLVITTRLLVVQLV